MTTIVMHARDQIAVSDSLVTDNHIVVDTKTEKVLSIKTEDGWYLVGIAGDYDALVMLKKLEEEKVFKTLEELFKELNSRLEKPSYTWLAVEYGNTKELLHGCELGVIGAAGQYYAIGSGAHIALGAMDMHDNTVKACQIAAERDVWSGGPIKQYDFIPF